MTEKALAKREVSDPLVVSMDTAKFEQMWRVARAMGDMSLIPSHLQVRPYWYPRKGEMAPGAAEDMRKKLGDEAFFKSYQVAERKTAANCFRVINQAMRWGFDPFAIIDSTYSVGDGRLGYEGKLVAAVVNTRGGLTDRLSYEFAGEGDRRTVTVTGTLAGETKPRTVAVELGNAKTFDKGGKPKEIWIKDPDQKLVYNGAAKWARRHCPEVMLGVFTDDDIDRIAVIEGKAEASSPTTSTRALVADTGEPEPEDIQAPAVIAEDETQGEPGADAEGSQEEPAGPRLLAMVKEKLLNRQEITDALRATRNPQLLGNTKQLEDLQDLPWAEVEPIVEELRGVKR